MTAHHLIAAEAPPPRCQVFGRSWWWIGFRCRPPRCRRRTRLSNKKNPGGKRALLGSVARAFVLCQLSGIRLICSEARLRVFSNGAMWLPGSVVALCS